MSKLFQGEKVVRVVTHADLHLDELVAMWELLRFGQEAFPGIETAVLEYSDTGGPTLDGRSALEWEREGVLYLGTGRGRFDEHGLKDQSQETCTAMLVAEALGIQEDLALGKILEFTLKGDRHGGNHPFDLAYLIKTMHGIGEPLAELLNWASKALQAVYADQQHFFGEVAAAYEKEATKYTVVIPDPRPVVEEGEERKDRELVVVAIKSDDPAMERFARSQHGGNAAIVVIQTRRGNIQVFGSRRQGIQMDNLATMIRLEEQYEAGSIQTTSWEKLRADGNAVKGAERWYYDREGRFILNGSRTAKDVEPTRLALDGIARLACIAIDPNRFAPDFARTCTQGKCMSTKKHSCPFRQWGMDRCRTIRFNELVAAGKIQPANEGQGSANEAAA